MIYISAPIEKGTSVKCSIYDAAGKLVTKLYEGIWNQDVLNLVWDTRDKNCGNVESGVYFIKLTTSTIQDCAKIIITE